MTKSEMVKLMDAAHGPGAGRRWLASLATEETAVFELGERIGYGRVMQLAEKLWRDANAAAYPGTEGGEHSALEMTGVFVGPCETFLVQCPCRQAHKCDWCCGSGRITKRVRQAMLDQPETPL